MIPVPDLPVHGMGGQRLPAAVQARMEAFFGADFSDVRVHVSPMPARMGDVVRGGVDTTPRPIRRDGPVEPALRSWSAAEVRAHLGLDAGALVVDQEYRGSTDGARYQYKGSYRGVMSLAPRYSFKPL